jgi:spore coat protein U-like protein
VHRVRDDDALNPSKDTIMIFRRILSPLGAATIAMALVSAAAHAGSASQNLGVTASVADNCVLSTSAVAFGGYDPVSANASSDLTGTGSVSVTCTTGASAKITLGQGLNADTGSTDSAPARRLTDDGTNYLTYQLYSDSARTTVWGNDTGSGVSHTGTGTAATLTVYGAITQGQNVPKGSYADTVVATVSF